MSTKLRVENIASAVLAEDLRAAFAKFGQVDAVEFAKDAATGVNNGCAIVAMARDQDAADAIRRLNLTQYAGRTITVDWSQQSFSMRKSYAVD